MIRPCYKHALWWRISEEHPWVCQVCNPCMYDHDLVEWRGKEEEEDRDAD